MRKTKKVVLVSVIAGLLLLAALPASASAGLAGWQYQREIAIQENSGETLRDYQVLVALSGSDFPGEAQADGDDIRFTDADGVDLGYWIEEFDAGSEHAMIWVNVPEIPANGEAGIVMWYGNPDAESGSDGEAVFEFFDDFEDGDYMDKWTVISGTWSEHDGIIEQTTATQNNWGIQAKMTDISDAVMEANAMRTGGSTRYGSVAIKLRDIVQLNFRYNEYAQTSELRVDSPSFWVDSGFSFSDNTWYHLKLMLLGTKAWSWIDGTQKHNNIDIGSVSAGKARLNNYFGTGKWDDIRVRRYTSLEPTVTIAPPAPTIHTALAITKSPAPHSIRQFQETTITISVENTGTTDATDIEITDTIHPGLDLTSGDFPNPLRYDLIRPGETRDLQYTISAKESGTFTLDPATVTYADEDGNIQEASSEPASIKVIPSTEGSTSSGTSRSNPAVSTASVQLHGEKTDVVLGEDILLKLSAVNLITKPTMHVQVIIIPPSGMSVTSSAFAKSGAGQYTTTYELEHGTGKDIEVAIRSNQVGGFDVNGRIIYYFGDDRDDSEDHTLTLPITVRAEAEQGAERTAGASESEESSTPGFVAVVAVIGVLLVALLIKRRRLR